MRKFVLVMLAALLTGFAHKYYVSVTVMKYNPENRHLEIVIHSFADDVALGIRKASGYRVDWDRPDGQARRHIAAYIRSHLSLEVDGKELAYKYLGFTFDNDQLLLVLETEPLPAGRTLHVRQSWLTEVYAEQRNLVHLIAGTHKQSEILDKFHTETEFGLAPLLSSHDAK